ARLFKEEYAPLLLFSGKGALHHSLKDNIQGTNWEKSEAEVFADTAIKEGVSKDKIIIENESTNSELNVRCTERLLREKGIKAEKIILVHKPYMQRRAYATFKNFWSDKNAKLMITSFNITFEDYPNEEINKEMFINILVGDLYRIKVYPEKGFQIYQEIPKDVWESFIYLVNKGYTKHIPEEEIE